jgi:peptidoglycan hydrolase-like protein with peptidoglycan-binding domain
MEEKMRQNNEREAVRNIQRYLRRLSYTDPSIPPVPIDGIFGEATRASLMAFQKMNGLNGSGVADRESWEVLYKSYLAAVDRYTPPSGFSVFPRVPDGYSMGVGEVSFAVSTVQYLLSEVSAIIDAIEEVPITGKYDIETARAVSLFQNSSGIGVTGEVDLTTWESLVDTYERYGRDYSQ